RFLLARCAGERDSRRAPALLASARPEAAAAAELLRGEVLPAGGEGSTNVAAEALARLTGAPEPHAVAAPAGGELLKAERPGGARPRRCGRGHRCRARAVARIDDVGGDAADDGDDHEDQRAPDAATRKGAAREQPLETAPHDHCTVIEARAPMDP